MRIRTVPLLSQQGFQIRRAEISDIEACNKIARQYPKELAFVRKNSLLRGVENKSLHVATIKDTGVVGFVLYHARKDGQQTIYDIAVDKNWRSQGIGRYLIWSIQCPIQLKVKKSNSAVRFYEKLGFVRVSETDTLYQYRLNRLVIFCAGGNRRNSEIARSIGLAWGAAQAHTVYDYPVMFDVEFVPEKQNWQSFLEKVELFRPLYALVTDYTAKEEKARLNSQIQDLRDRGVLHILICPKFDGAVLDIPGDCTPALSVPARGKFSGFWPSKSDLFSLAGRKVHLLGGSPKNQAAKIRELYELGVYVSSLDNNSAIAAAAYSTCFLDTGKWYRQSKRRWEFGDRFTTLVKSLVNIKKFLESV